MNEQTLEERVRAKAHEIWEGEGRPEGQQDRHWQIACQMIDDTALAESQPGSGKGYGRRPEADGLNPVQGSSDASESRVSPIPREERPLD